MADDQAQNDSGFDVGKIIDFFQGFMQQMQDAGWSSDQGIPGMDTNTLDMFSEFLPWLGMYSEMQKQSYQDQALDVLKSQNDMDQAQYDLAKKQFEFQSGDYWDWYTHDFFPQQVALQQQGYDTQKLGYETQQKSFLQQLAQGDQQVNQSKNYALAQAYNTQAAQDQAELQRQALLLQSAARPQGYGWGNYPTGVR